METEPIKKLMRKYQGNLLNASGKEIAQAFRSANSNLEKIIGQAELEYQREKEKEKKAGRKS